MFRRTVEPIIAILALIGIIILCWFVLVGTVGAQVKNCGGVECTITKTPKPTITSSLTTVTPRPTETSVPVKTPTPTPQITLMTVTPPPPPTLVPPKRGELCCIPGPGCVCEIIPLTDLQRYGSDSEELERHVVFETDNPQGHCEPVPPKDYVAICWYHGESKNSGHGVTPVLIRIAQGNRQYVRVTMPKGAK